MIGCGGDADTTAAITGGIGGCRVGVDGIPMTLRQEFVDWPRSLKWIGQLGYALTIPRDQSQHLVIRASYLALLLRNSVFVPTVLFHGFRRLLPPY